MNKKINSSSAVSLKRRHCWWGRIVQGENINETNFKIDLPNISKGIYFLKIGNKTHLETIKLIKE
jgi:hypothetical protein